MVIHIFLGMTLDYTTPKTVKINMDQYVEEILAEFPESVKSVSTPSSITLFQLQDDMPQLEEKRHNCIIGLWSN